MVLYDYVLVDVVGMGYRLDEWKIVVFVWIIVGCMRGYFVCLGVRWDICGICSTRGVVGRYAMLVGGCLKFQVGSRCGGGGVLRLFCGIALLVLIGSISEVADTAREVGLPVVN